MHICKEAIELSIDLKLSAFVYESFESPLTIVKSRNPKARIELIERKLPTISGAEKEMEDS
jgi:hypothetical protein